MNIDKKGFSLDTLSDILDAFELSLKSKYGADFYIKPEGVIDNIVNSCAFIEMSIQEQIAFLAKQFDPETAEGDWQDALYERIGISRLEAQQTTFVRTVKGAQNLSVKAGEIIIRAKNTEKDEFVNLNDFTTDETGSALVDFQCVLYGAIDVPGSLDFEIVTAPDGITATERAQNPQVSIGRERETDNNFRMRFRTSKALNAKATRTANEANLSKFVENIAFLKIIDKKSDNTFEPGTLKIIAHHNTTDNIFANAVFESAADGIELLGDTEVTLTDASNQPVLIKFKNADEITVSIQAEVKIRNGYYANTVFSNVRKNIIDYAQKRIFGLASVIYATEFIIPILEIDGVEAVKAIKVKRDEDFTDSISMSQEEVPIFDIERIILNEPS